MTTQTGHGQVLSIGAVVADTYQVTRLLGRGGMGAVWEAAHLRLPGKKVAIKVLHADVAADPEALARFRREAEIASRLGHPNIVEVHDFNSLPDGQPYLVLELLIGESLDSRMRRAPVSLDNAMRIAGQVGAGLAAAHREQVIHRDLKPHNVFLVRLRDEADGGELVKVLDFGISKIRGSQTIKTLDSTILGTPQYMAPEQATGNHAAVDQRTDVFALGAIVYEMLAGRPAFTGGSIPEVVFKVVYEPHAPLGGQVPGLPRRVADAVDRALAKKQDDRFPDVVSFVEQMAGASISTLRRSPIVAAPPGPGDANPADPLAHTVDSSRRELAPVPEPPEPPVATAETRARTGETPPITPGGHTAEPPRESMAQVASEPAARRKLVATAISLLVLAGTASGIALMARSSDRSPSAVATGPAPATSDPARPDPAPSTSATPVPPDPSASATPVPRPADVAPGDAPADAPEDAIEPPTSDAPDQPSPSRPTRPRRPRPAEPEEPADVRAQVTDGEAALRAGDHRQALVLAERALRSGAGPAAHALRAKASCAIGDLGNAKASFVRIPRRNLFLRRRVLSFCTRSGVDLRP